MSLQELLARHRALRDHALQNSPETTPRFSEGHEQPPLVIPDSLRMPEERLSTPPEQEIPAPLPLPMPGEIPVSSNSLPMPEPLEFPAALAAEGANRASPPEPPRHRWEARLLSQPMTGEG